MDGLKRAFTRVHGLTDETALDRLPSGKAFNDAAKEAGLPNRMPDFRFMKLIPNTEVLPHSDWGYGRELYGKDLGILKMICQFSGLAELSKGTDKPLPEADVGMVLEKSLGSLRKNIKRHPGTFFENLANHEKMTQAMLDGTLAPDKYGMRKSKLSMERHPSLGGGPETLEGRNILQNISNLFDRMISREGIYSGLNDDSVRYATKLKRDLVAAQGADAASSAAEALGKERAAAQAAGGLVPPPRGGGAGSGAGGADSSDLRSVPGARVRADTEKNAAAVASGADGSADSEEPPAASTEAPKKPEKKEENTGWRARAQARLNAARQAARDAAATGLEVAGAVGDVDTSSLADRTRAGILTSGARAAAKSARDDARALAKDMSRNPKDYARALGGAVADEAFGAGTADLASELASERRAARPSGGGAGSAEAAKKPEKKEENTGWRAGAQARLNAARQAARDAAATGLEVAGAVADVDAGSLADRTRAGTLTSGAKAAAKSARDDARALAKDMSRNPKDYARALGGAVADEAFGAGTADLASELAAERRAARPSGGGGASSGSDAGLRQRRAEEGTAPRTPARAERPTVEGPGSRSVVARDDTGLPLNPPGSEDIGPPAALPMAIHRARQWIDYSKTLDAADRSGRMRAREALEGILVAIRIEAKDVQFWSGWGSFLNTYTPAEKAKYQFYADGGDSSVTIQNELSERIRALS